MNTYENAEAKSSRTLSPQVVAAIIGIVAFLGPIVGQIYSYPGMGGSQLSIIALTWMYYSDFGFMFQPFLIFSGILYGTLRPVFAYLMYRLYQEKTTKKRAVIVGIAAELQIVVIFLISFIPMLLSPYPGMFYLPIIFPIPILILVGLTIIKVFPPKVNVSWVESEESKHWWEKVEDKTGTPADADETVPKTESAKDTIPDLEDDWLKEN